MATTPNMLCRELHAVVIATLARIRAGHANSLNFSDPAGKPGTLCLMLPVQDKCLLPGSIRTLCQGVTP